MNWLRRGGTEVSESSRSHICFQLLSIQPLTVSLQNNCDRGLQSTLMDFFTANCNSMALFNFYYSGIPKI